MTDPGCMYVTRARLHLSSTNSNLYIHAHTLGLAPLHTASIRAINRSTNIHTHTAKGGGRLMAYGLSNGPAAR